MPVAGGEPKPSVVVLLVSAKSARMWERAVLTNRPLLDLSPFVLEGL
jgi:hypothetical protein